MQLSPRYEGAVPLSVEVSLADPSIPLFRQRRRLADILAGLDAKQWSFPSRCSGWSVHDVTAHLVGVNRFWSLSVRSGLAGTPTRYLTAFDPVTTPRLLVEPMRDLSHAAILGDYIESLDDLTAAFDGVDADLWSRLAEAPPGHVTLQTLALHALWDGWVHERDIVLPLALAPVEEADEVTACLLYAAILGPTISAARRLFAVGHPGRQRRAPDDRLRRRGRRFSRRPLPGAGGPRWARTARSGRGPHRRPQSAGPAGPRSPP